MFFLIFFTDKYALKVRYVMISTYLVRCWVLSKNLSFDEFQQNYSNILVYVCEFRIL